MSEDQNTNPKALNLEAIRTSTNKVTLGFKCSPNVKLELARQAQELGLTLSEHVENLIMNHEKITDSKRDADKREIQKLTEKVNEQSELINFYENDFLKKILKEYKNRTVEYKDAQNKDVNLKITDLKTVYTAVITSFKIDGPND